MIYYEYIIKYYSLMASRSEQQWDCSKLQAYVEYDERNNNSIIASIPESSCTYDMWQKTRGAWSIIAIKIISNNNKVIMIIIIVTSYFTLIDKWLLLTDLFLRLLYDACDNYIFMSEVKDVKSGGRWYEQ